MISFEHFLNFVIRSGIAFLVVFTPLAFGTVEIWSFAVLHIISFSIFAAWFSKKIWCCSKISIVKSNVLKREQIEYFRSIPFYMRPGLIRFFLKAVTMGVFPRVEKEHQEKFRYYVFAGRKVVNTGIEGAVILLLLLVLLQTIPLPSSVMECISPGTYQFYNEYLPGYSEGCVDFTPYLSVLDKGQKNLNAMIFSSWRPLSNDPSATIRFLMKLISCFTVFFVAVNEFREESDRKFFIYLLAFMGLFIAMEGLLQYYHDNSRLLMFRPRPEHDTGAAFGPFINRNHFAGYIEMIFPVTLAMFINLFLRRDEKRTATHSITYQNRDGKLVYKFEQKFTEFYSMAFLGIYALGVMAGGIIIAGSKAGIFIMFVSAFAMLALTRMKKTLIFVCLAVVAAGIFSFMIYEKTEIIAAYDKAKMSSVTTRTIAWKSCIDIFADYPLFGTGVGSYAVVSGRYVPEGAPWKFYEAHNDYLEILATGGVLIFSISILIALYILGEGLRFLKLGIRKNIFQLSFLVSIGAMLLHEVVDFNLQIGSNAFLFSLIAGLLIGSINFREIKK